eukprot:gnl/MRDRNA2_/MRDRNA2_236144_c0_seq1.p1 gnl/MRDRNA2_/MRDRNA2_236144_c0~~gnl/MRDRNA2_/MRDRNA2_236144_c0_seq1.p1  ORF type:complete len:470 (+),score=107.27 gnl/MRDRNA2_/MRDRNA2_236144_c0_seq1:2-1411(+)
MKCHWQHFFRIGVRGHADTGNKMAGYTTWCRHDVKLHATQGPFFKRRFAHHRLQDASAGKNGEVPPKQWDEQEVEELLKRCRRIHSDFKDLPESIQEVNQKLAQAAEKATELLQKAEEIQKAAKHQLKGSSEAVEDKSTAAEVALPDKKELRLLMLNCAIPFVGFGFLDNFIMIVFGDMIDKTLCVSLCLSTMTAAAIGNTLSDMCGCVSGGLIEKLAKSLGLRRPSLTDEQSELSIAQRYRMLGEIAGVFLGCVLGCSPLYFLDTTKAEKQKKKQRKNELLAAVTKEVAQTMKAERAVLFLAKTDKKTGQKVLVGRGSTGIRLKLAWGTGIVGHVAQTGKTVNSSNVYEGEMKTIFHHEIDQIYGYKTRSCLSVPVKSVTGDTLAVLQIANKIPVPGEPIESAIFSENDQHDAEEIAGFLAIEIDGANSLKRVLEVVERRMDRRAETLKESTFRKILDEDYSDSIREA